LASPDTLVEVDDVTAVIPPGSEATVYTRDGSTLLLEVGGSQLTVAEASPAVATRFVGAPGGSSVTLFEGAEPGPVPIAFVAVTVNV
jgi:hypothetical protein